MSTESRVPVGRIESLWRYPVKSMLGETVPAAEVDDRGLAGDRALAVVDRETGVVATAKHPRRWRALLQARAEAAADGTVLLHLPDGPSVLSSHPVVDELLSSFLGRPVTLAEARLEDIPHQHLVDPLGVDRGPPQGLGHGDGPELGGGHPRQSAGERPDRGPHRARDHRLGHRPLPPVPSAAKPTARGGGTAREPCRR